MTSSGVISNYTISPTQSSLQRYCPLNEFCSANTPLNCFNTSIITCDDCNSSAAIGYGVVVAVLGLVILFGNSLIILILIQRYRSGHFLKIDAIKLSLAFADFLSGIQIFAVLLPSFAYKMNSTVSDIMARHVNGKSPDAIVCGVFLILTFSSSIYHLIFLGAQRLYAIKLPLRYKLQLIRWVYLYIVVVWVLAIVTAATPGFFPNSFRYCERSNVCFFCSSSLMVHLIIYCLFLFLPFTIMTFISITTAIVGKRQINESRRVLGGGDRNHAMNFRRTLQELTIFKTVALMQVGFTLSLGPAIVSLTLVFLNLFGCHVADLLETVSFTLYFLNSLTNVLIYSVRDEKFRRALVAFFKTTSSKHIGKNLKSRSPAGTPELNRTRYVETTMTDNKLRRTSKPFVIPRY